MIGQQLGGQGGAEQVEAQHGLGAPKNRVGGGQYPYRGQECREEVPAQHRHQHAEGVGQQGDEEEAHQKDGGVVGAEAEVIVSHLLELQTVGDEEGDQNAQRGRDKAEEVAQDKLLGAGGAHRQVEGALPTAPQEAEQTKGGEDTVEHRRDADGDGGVLHDEGEGVGFVALQTLADKGQGEEEQEPHEGHPPVTAGCPQNLMEEGAEFTLCFQRVLRCHSSFLPSSFHT